MVHISPTSSRELIHEHNQIQGKIYYTHYRHNCLWCNNAKADITQSILSLIIALYRKLEFHSIHTDTGLSCRLLHYWYVNLASRNINITVALPSQIKFDTPFDITDSLLYMYNHKLHVNFRIYNPLNMEDNCLILSIMSKRFFSV